MLRKLFRSNVTGVALTGIMWLVTIFVRFVMLGQTLPPEDYLIWIVCNNIMVAGFAYQLGCLTFNRKMDKLKWRWFRHGYREGHAKAREDCE